MALSYHKLEKEIESRIISDRREHKQNPYKASDDDAIRRNPDKDKSTLLRPAYARDIDKILHLPLYNRYNNHLHPRRLVRVLLYTVKVVISDSNSYMVQMIPKWV